MAVGGGPGRRRPRGRLLAFPGAFTLLEAVRMTWPFGGLPIGGVFLGQAGGPLLGAARLGGPAAPHRGGLGWAGPGWGAGLASWPWRGRTAGQGAASWSAAATASPGAAGPWSWWWRSPWPVRSPPTAGRPVRPPAGGRGAGRRAAGASAERGRPAERLRGPAGGHRRHWSTGRRPHAPAGGLARGRDRPRPARWPAAARRPRMAVAGPAPRTPPCVAGVTEPVSATALPQPGRWPGRPTAGWSAPSRRSTGCRSASTSRTGVSSPTSPTSRRSRSTAVPGHGSGLLRTPAGAARGARLLRGLLRRPGPVLGRRRGRAAGRADQRLVLRAQPGAGPGGGGRPGAGGRGGARPGPGGPDRVLGRRRQPRRRAPALGARAAPGAAGHRRPADRRAPSTSAGATCPCWSSRPWPWRPAGCGTPVGAGGGPTPGAASGSVHCRMSARPTDRCRGARPAARGQRAVRGRPSPTRSATPAPPVGPNWPRDRPPSPSSCRAPTRGCRSR